MANWTVLSLLEAGRNRLSKPELWCSNGSRSGSGDNQACCAIITLSKILEQDEVAFECGAHTDARVLLREASQELFHEYLVNVNDGGDSHMLVPREQRYQNVLKVYDRAIAKARKEMGQ